MNEVKDYASNPRPLKRPVEREALVAEINKLCGFVQDDKGQTITNNEALANLMVDYVSTKTVMRQHAGELWEQIEQLSAKIAALEARPKGGAGVTWAGTHVHGQRYAEGNLCTRGGSLWLAKNSTIEAPGQSSSWVLICKRGEA
jgi:hypothetical protein